MGFLPAQFYFAPMEGITDCYFRSIHAALFPDGKADKYFAPFFSPTLESGLGDRERKALSHDSNPGLTLIPQILCNQAALFVKTALEIAELGYSEINLNLGCPSGTVVSKHKGAGFLEDPDVLDRFFDAVFSDPALGSLQISVKTRLGMRDPAEFDDLLPIYNRYPIRELIIHPRVRTEQYRGTVHVDRFLSAMEDCPHPLCYNGDIFTKKDFDRLSERLTGAPERPVSLMLGRGLVSNPALITVLRGGTPLSKGQLRAFSDALFEDARSRLSGERHMLFRMKELWAYWSVLFDADAAKPYLRGMRKALTLAEFRMQTDALIDACPLSPDAGFSGDGSL